MADLQAFQEVVADVPDRGSVRLRTATLDGVEEVITLRLDLEYWPTSELSRDGSGWTRTLLPISGSSGSFVGSDAEQGPASSP